MVIPTLVVVITKKFFGNKKEDDEGAIGEHPVVRFLFAAMTTGNVDATEEMVLDGKARCMGHPKCVASNWWLLTADIAQAYLRQVLELTDVAYIPGSPNRTKRTMTEREQQRSRVALGQPAASVA